MRTIGGALFGALFGVGSVIMYGMMGRLLLGRLFPAWDMEGTIFVAFGAGGVFAAICALFGWMSGLKLDIEEKRRKQAHEGRQQRSAKAANAPSLFWLMLWLRAQGWRILSVALFWIYQGGPALLILSVACFLLGFLTNAAPFFLAAKLLTVGFLWTVLFAFLWHFGVVAMTYAEENIKREKIRKFIALECICGSYLGGGSVYFFLMFWPVLCVHIVTPYVLAADGNWAWVYYSLSFLLCLFIYCNRAIRAQMHTETDEQKKKILKKLMFEILVGITIFPIAVFQPGTVSKLYEWIL